MTPLYALYQMTKSGYILMWDHDFKGNPLRSIEQAQGMLDKYYKDDESWGIERINS